MLSSKVMAIALAFMLLGLLSFFVDSYNHNVSDTHWFLYLIGFAIMLCGTFLKKRERRALPPNYQPDKVVVDKRRFHVFVVCASIVAFVG